MPPAAAVSSPPRACRVRDPPPRRRLGAPRPWPRRSSRTRSPIRRWPTPARIDLTSAAGPASQVVSDRRGSVVRRVRRRPHRSAVERLVLAAQAKSSRKRDVKVTRIRVLVRLAARSWQSARSVSSSSLPDMPTPRPRPSGRRRRRSLTTRAVVSTRGQLLRAGHDTSRVSPAPVHGHRGSGQSARTRAGGLRRHQRAREWRAGGSGFLLVDVGDQPVYPTRRVRRNLPAAPNAARRAAHPTSSPLEWQYATGIGRGHGALDRNGVRPEHPRCHAHRFAVRRPVRQSSAPSGPSSVTTVRRILAVSKSWTSGSTRAT